MCYLCQSSRYSEYMLWINFCCREVALSMCLQVLSDFGDSPSYPHKHESRNTLSHIPFWHIPTCTHIHTLTCANIHTHIVVKLWGWEALSICLCSSAFYTLFSCTLFSLSTFSLSHSVPFLPCLSVPIVSHLFPHLPSFPLFPSHLLSSDILPYHLLLSVNFKVHTDSVFCRYGVFKASEFLGCETITSDTREEGQT